MSDAKVELTELREALQSEVIKHEVMEGDKADGARKKVSRAAGKMLRIRKGKDEPDEVSASGDSSVVLAAPTELKNELT